MILKKYPVSEIFTSPQGEGFYAGTLMTFVRLAGCSVGKPRGAQNAAAGLPIYIEKCTSWDGREFLCDTDFRTKEILTVEEIMLRVPQGVEHVCITGGEPLIHDLIPLLQGLKRLPGADEVKRYIVPHLETSGTIFENEIFSFYGRTHVTSSSENTSLWISVSPKLGCRKECIDRADEIKLLVDRKFDLDVATELVGNHELVYLQPIGDELSLIPENVKNCLAIQKQIPSWRLSLQIHKILGVR